LCQIFPDKTEDVGKKCIVFVESISGYPLLVNLCDEPGAGSKNSHEYWYTGKKSDYSTSPHINGLQQT
jgi:hypothetical protein